MPTLAPFLQLLFGILQLHRPSCSWFRVHYNETSHNAVVNYSRSPSHKVVPLSKVYQPLAAIECHFSSDNCEIVLTQTVIFAFENYNPLLLHDFELQRSQRETHFSHRSLLLNVLMKSHTFMPFFHSHGNLSLAAKQNTWCEIMGKKKQNKEQRHMTKTVHTPRNTYIHTYMHEILEGKSFKFIKQRV